MNKYLEQFVKNNFEKSGKALDLGAGDFSDVSGLEKMGWECEGVDIKKGIDLEKLYLSNSRPFDLVYSNYLLQKLENKKELIQTAYDNLKEDGWFFVHTFNKSDTNSNSEMDSNYLEKILRERGFKNIEIRVFDYFDEEEGHNHWHKILEAVAQK